MSRMTGVLGALALLALAAPAEAACLRCSFTQTGDPICVVKASGYTDCSTWAGPGSRGCETLGDLCGSGGVGEAEQPMTSNRCRSERWVLTSVDLPHRDERLRVVVAAVTPPRAASVRGAGR